MSYKKQFVPATTWCGIVCVACWASVVLALSAMSPGRLAAQEISGLQAALALEKVLVDTIAQGEKSVVAIARVRKGGDHRVQMSPDFIPNQFGTGVVIDRRGLILTNYHVLGDIEKNDYYVWIKKKPFRARATVEAADPWMDLAVLRIDADDLQPIKFGNAGKLKKGQIVIALGNPYAIARDGEVSASWGIVSNLARKAPPLHGKADRSSGKDTLHHFGTLIQTDIRLNRGTSGGALLNLKGEMIGLTTSLEALAGNGKSAGFAIPVDEAFKRTVETLKKGRKAAFGFLGIGLLHLTADERQQGRFGAQINKVESNTPASKAGLKPGDIVTHVNGEKIYDPNVLVRELSKLPAEAQATLTIKRHGNRLVKNIVLSKKYIESSRPAYSRIDDPSWRGLRVDYATAIPPRQLDQHSREIDIKGCVALVEVKPDTPAWKAGLRPWMFVSHVENTRVSSPRQFYNAVAGKEGVVRLHCTSASGREKPVRAVSP